MNNELHFMSDKYLPPVLPKVFAPRVVLSKTISNLKKKRLLFVHAPAGYGKTISAAIWANTTKSNVSWFHLDEYDNEITAFCRLVSSCIYSTQKQNPKIIEILKNEEFAKSPVECTISFINDTVFDSEKCTIIIDGFHNITNPEIIKLMPYLLRRLPYNYSVIILSRHDFPDEYSEYIFSEKMAVLDSKNLAFSQNEIKDFYQMHNISIADTDVERIYEFTEGWPVSVNALVSAKSTSPQDLLSNSNFLKYINVHIWNNLSADIKEFIQIISILDEFDADICQLLTGNSEAKNIIDKFAQDGAFIHISGNNQYRFNNAIRQFFLARFSDSSDVDVKQLYKTASEYYINTEEHFKARIYAVKSGEYSLIAKSVYYANKMKINNLLPDYVKFSQIFFTEILPHKIADKLPIIYLNRVFYHFLAGEASKMLYYLDKVYENLPVLIEDFPELMELVLIISSLDHRCTLEDTLARFSPEIIKNFSASEQQIGVTDTLHLPFLHRSVRDYYELTIFNNISEFNDSLNVILKDSYELVYNCLSACFMFEKHKFDEAVELSEKSLRLIRPGTTKEYKFSVYSIMAISAYFTNNKNKYNDYINKISVMIYDDNSKCLEGNFMSLKTRFAVWNGDIETIKQWFDSPYYSDSGYFELYKIHQNFTTARAQIALGEYDKASICLNKLQLLATDFDRPTDLAEALVLQSILANLTGKKNEAVSLLAKAVETVQPMGYISVIASEGAAVLPILQWLAQKVERTSNFDSISQKFLNEIYLATYSISKQMKDLTCFTVSKTVVLSKQQKLILNLLAKGYKNSEIVNLLEIKLSTVKSHTTAAYSKLNVNNAADAVTRARELNLID